MTPILSAFPLTLLELALIASVVGLFVISFYSNKRRIKRLEDRLAQTQALLAREIKMVNQGAIGVGRRFAQVEKKMQGTGGAKASFQVKPTREEKPLSKASKFAQIQELAAKQVVQEPQRKTAAPKGLTTKAEQSLTSWLKEQQTA